MKFDIRPVVEAQLEKINEKLADALEITDGVNLTGKINELRIQEIIAGQRKLLVSVSILGTNVLNIESISF